MGSARSPSSRLPCRSGSETAGYRASSSTARRASQPGGDAAAFPAAVPHAMKDGTLRRRLGRAAGASSGRARPGAGRRAACAGRSCLSSEPEAPRRPRQGHAPPHPSVVLRDFLEDDRARSGVPSGSALPAFYDLGEDASGRRTIFSICSYLAEREPRLNVQLGVFERRTGRLCGCAGLRGRGNRTDARFSIRAQSRPMGPVPGGR